MPKSKFSTQKDDTQRWLSPIYHWQHRVYYSDTDAMGAVYHANYLTLFERARAHALMDCQYLLKDCEADGVMFVVHQAHLNYHQPMMLDDVFTVASAMASRKRTSMVWHQEMVRERDSTLICTADIHIVCVNRCLKPQAIPDTMLNKVCQTTTPPPLNGTMTQE